MSLLARVAAASLIAAVPMSVQAHHGWSSYDESKPVTLVGPLKDVSWKNPHATAKMNWQNKEWDVILAPISRLNTRGLEEGDINRRQRVTITGYVRRDGAPEMRLERIKVGNKTVELR